MQSDIDGSCATLASFLGVSHDVLIVSTSIARPMHAVAAGATAVNDVIYSSLCLFFYILLRFLLRKTHSQFIRCIQLGRMFSCRQSADELNRRC